MISESEPAPGELFRLCQAIDIRITRMEEAAQMSRHEMRNIVHAQALQLGAHEEKIKVILDKLSFSRQWLAGIISGTMVGVIVLAVTQWLHPLR